MANKVKGVEIDSVREKLARLLDGVLTIEDVTTSEEVADHLIAHGVTVQKWIPVTERPPKKPGNYWVVKRRLTGDIAVVARWNGCDWIENGKEIGVTHWMPLPEPPKED